MGASNGALFQSLKARDGRLGDTSGRFGRAPELGVRAPELGAERARPRERSCRAMSFQEVTGQVRQRAYSEHESSLIDEEPRRVVTGRGRWLAVTRRHPDEDEQAGNGTLEEGKIFRASVLVDHL